MSKSQLITSELKESSMESVSTGVGLCVLSATIAACFAVSHFGGEARAFARSPDQLQPQPARIGPDKSKTAPSAEALSGSSCQVTPLAWFDPIPRRINTCAGTTARETGALNRGSADVNADGVSEYFEFPPPGGRMVIVEGANQSGTIVFASETIDLGAEVYLKQTSVLDANQDTAQGIRAMLPTANLRSAFVVPVGWRDIDNDGDLDLICNVQYQIMNLIGEWYFDIWFENTEFQAAHQPNPYDLDQDGEVGASDISVLLLNYSK